MFLFRSCHKWFDIKVKCVRKFEKLKIFREFRKQWRMKFSEHIWLQLWLFWFVWKAFQWFQFVWKILTWHVPTLALVQLRSANDVISVRCFYIPMKQSESINWARKRDEYKTGWPSGLRRWIKAPISSGAWVRIPLQSNFLYWIAAFFQRNFMVPKWLTELFRRW